MTEKNPVPEIGKGILRPHAVIWPPLMFAFTNLGKLALLSCIHSNKRLSVKIVYIRLLNRQLALWAAAGGWGLHF